MFIMKLSHPATHSKKSFGWNAASVHTSPAHNVSLNNGGFQALHKVGKMKV
jgi:hypothetical protein